jgi:putative membrane protein
MWHDMGFGVMMWYGWIFWIIIIGIVVYLIVKLANRSSSGSNNQSNDTPMDILKKRYARGEISKEEFENIKKDLI